MLITSEVVLAKIQADANTPATPAATDAVLVSNLKFGYHNPRMNERNIIKNTLGKARHLFGGTLASLSFDVELKGSGSAGTAPEFDELLRACAVSATVVAGTSVTYNAHSDSATMEYLTIHYYQDGKRKVLQNAVGEVSLNADVGAPGMLSFTFYGHEGTETDTAMITPTYDSTEPSPYINAAFSVGGYAAAIGKLTLGLGNQVVTPPSVSAANGYGQIRITGRDVAGSFDPEDTLLATHDFVSEWKGGSVLALDSGVVGSTAGNRWQLQCPAISYREVSQADRDDLRTLEIGFGAAEVNGDDEFSLIFT